jgi:hypothetical protein
VVESIWSEADGKWKLVIERDGTRFNDKCDIFINAAGILKYVFRRTIKYTSGMLIKVF